MLIHKSDQRVQVLLVRYQYQDLLHILFLYGLKQVQQHKLVTTLRLDGNVFKEMQLLLKLLLLLQQIGLVIVPLQQLQLIIVRLRVILEELVVVKH